MIIPRYDTKVFADRLIIKLYKYSGVRNSICDGCKRAPKARAKKCKKFFKNRNFSNFSNYDPQQGRTQNSNLGVARVRTDPEGIRFITFYIALLFPAMGVA